MVSSILDEEIVILLQKQLKNNFTYVRRAINVEEKTCLSSKP